MAGDGRQKPGFKHVELEKMQASWEIPERYTQIAVRGSGAFSVVCRSYDTKLGIRVAIKKLKRPFQTEPHSKFAFRELRLLRHMDHPNIVRLVQAFTPQTCLRDFQDLYLVCPLMDMDLAYVLKKHGALTDENSCFLVYQLLCAIKYLHSVGIAHRDIKPENIGLTADNWLRLLDFGQARIVEESEKGTGYVVTRWYRAPEVLLCRHHNLSVDLWSAGCVLAEMLQGEALFPGTQEEDLFKRMLSVLGPPDEHFMNYLSAQTKTHIARLSSTVDEPCGLDVVVRRAPPAALDLMKKLLIMNPGLRLTAEEALRHVYVMDYAEPDEEPDASPVDNADFNRQCKEVDEWREAIFEQLDFEASESSCAKLQEECSRLRFPE